MSLDIFNLSLDDFQKEETSNQSNLYKTDPKDGKDSIFRSVVRFLPNPRNPKQSSMKKLTYWLTDSEGNGSYFDSPKTVDRSAPCIIGDVWWKLSQSESAADKKTAERLRRKEYYFSLIQIIKDPQNPELEGTIQIYRYPKSIKKLIDSQINPAKEDIDLGAEPCNVFDLFEGKNFNIKVTLKGGYWNYDECKFADKTTSVEFNGSTIERTEQSQGDFLNYLETAPDISKYEYKELSEEQRLKLSEILSDIDASNPGSSYNALSKSAKENTTSQPQSVKTETTTEVTAETISNASAPTDDLEDFLNSI